MRISLQEIFESIGPISKEPTNKPFFSVMPVPGFSNYFVGKDKELLACLLVATTEPPGRLQTPIRLESLDAQFELPCRLVRPHEQGREGTFTVVRCRDSSREMTRYFLFVCETMLRVLGEHPTRAHIARAVNKLAEIFQRVRQPSTRSLNGLFGELFLLLKSRNTAAALSAWRAHNSARFDFSDGDIRLDVKSTSGRNRIHTFSYDQCNPPSGTVAVAASLRAEQAAGGATVYSIMNQIESLVSTSTELVFKLQETVAATLGPNLDQALQTRYDILLAESTLQFFDLADVPAIRGPLPVGVMDVHFRSDLSGLVPISIEALIDRDPMFWELLPEASDEM